MCRMYIYVFRPILAAPFSRIYTCIYTCTCTCMYIYTRIYSAAQWYLTNTHVSHVSCIIMCITHVASTHVQPLLLQPVCATQLYLLYTYTFTYMYFRAQDVLRHGSDKQHINRLSQTPSLCTLQPLKSGHLTSQDTLSSVVQIREVPLYTL